MKRLGIDVGGSGVKGAVVDVGSGELVTERFRLATPQPSVPEAVATAISAVIAEHGWSGPFGCTLPSVVSHGIVRSAANIDPSWVDVDGRALLEEATGADVTLLNDADAAGIAEVRFGAGRNQDGVVLMITFGTGIGSAVLVDGVLLPNTELGHLEMWGDSAEKRAAAKAYEDEELTYEAWTDRVNEYLAYVETLLWPDLIIVGGGISKDSGEFLHLLEARAEIRPAELRNNAGIVGAAMASVETHP